MGNSVSQGGNLPHTITPSSYAGQRQLWEPGFNTAVPAPSITPNTLTSGSFWGSSALGDGMMTSIHHPQVAAQMGAITVNIGGGRINPYGGGGIIEPLPRLAYTPTNNMPMPMKRRDTVEPIMGGEIAGQSISTPALIRWDAKQEPIDNRTSEMYFKAPSWGTTTY